MKKVKPVKAWAIQAANGSLVRHRSGIFHNELMVHQFPTRTMASEWCRVGEKPVEVIIRPAPKKARRA